MVTKNEKTNKKQLTPSAASSERDFSYDITSQSVKSADSDERPGQEEERRGRLQTGDRNFLSKDGKFGLSNKSFRSRSRFGAFTSVKLDSDKMEKL